jgi:2-amino-4-hydroxy-6-hydroxymethyldihydropteridine diphosphokinase
VVQIFIGMGSSLNRLENIKAGIAALQLEFDELVLSSIYESESVGFMGDNFYNLVVGCKTELAIEPLILRLKTIEVEHGRIKEAKKFAPRTLDLDLLLYDEVVDDENNLPRAEITKNAFVLKPLSEIAPQFKHPVLDETYQILWDNYPKDKQKLWKI